MKAVSLIKPPLSKKIKGGLVVLKKGEQIGEHTTENREEIIFILKGKAMIILEGKRNAVKEGFSFYIPPNKKHNVVNKNNQILKYLYIVSLFN